MDVNLDSLTDDMRLAIWIVIGARLLIWGFYANTVRKTMLRIADENRFFQPGQAWLLAVPIFNIYWNFVVARRLSDSLNNEFFDRKVAEEERPGLASGMSYAWMFLLSHIPLPPFLMIAFMILSIVYFIQYWVKVNNFRALLIEHDLFLKQEPRQKEKGESNADEIT